MGSIKNAVSARNSAPGLPKFGRGTAHCLDKAFDIHLVSRHDEYGPSHSWKLSAVCAAKRSASPVLG
jgi:hypothetical protein